MTDGDYWTFTGTDVPRIEFEYTSTTPIEVATDIAFYVHPSTGAVEIYQGLTNISGRFQRVMIGDYNGLRHNVSSSQAYFYQGDWEVDDGRASLNGNLLSGIVFGTGTIDTPKSIRFFTSIIGDPLGTSYGAQKCDSVPFTCEVPSGAMTQDDWEIKPGDGGHDLIDLIKQGNYCDPSTDFECPEVVIRSRCESLILDIIFLLDNSGSVDASEYQSMKSSIESTINELTVYPEIDARFAIVQYIDDRIEISEPFFSGYADLSNLSQMIGLNDDMNNALGHLISKLNSRELDVRPESNMHISVFTDAWADALASKILPLDNSNILKSSPFNATFTVVRYQGVDDFDANMAAAAVASLGMPYLGDVHPNPNDPEDQGAPRRFYPTSFPEGVPNLANDINECNSLSVNVSKYCLNPFIQWSAEDGGEILSFTQNVTEVEIAGPGTYIVDVGCSNGCTMKDIFIIDENGVVQRSGGPGGIRYIDGKAMSPGEYEEYLAGELSLKSLPDYQLSLFPNPSSTHINLIYNNDQDRYPAFKIYRSDGALVKEIIDYRIGEERTIDTQDLPSGLYYLRVTTSADIPVQPFTIIK